MAAAALTAFACWAPTFPDALLLGFARLAALLALAGCTGLAAQAAETLKVYPSPTTSLASLLLLQPQCRIACLCLQAEDHEDTGQDHHAGHSKG